MIEKKFQIENDFDRFQAIAGKKLSYYEYGNSDSKNIVICVHGFTRNATDFKFLAEAICSNARVIAIDIFGRGKSDWLDEPQDYNPVNYIVAIKSLLDELNIKKCHWVGTSMGGIIGMVFDATYTGIIDKLILNDIGPFVSSESVTRIADYAGKEKFFDNYDESKEYLKKIFKGFAIKDEKYWDFINSNSTKKLDNGKISFSYDLKIQDNSNRKSGEKIADIEFWDIWKILKANIYVLRGENSDILSKETMTQMKSHPNFKDAIELKNVGHAPSLMYDDQIEIIKKWLFN